MATRNPTPQVTSGEALEADRLVQMSGSTAVYCDAGDSPIGVTLDAVASGEVVALQPLDGSQVKLTADGAISAGSDLYPADDGKVSDTAVGNSIGQNLTAASADGGKMTCIAYGWPSNDIQTSSHGTVRFFEDWITGSTEDGHKISETANKGDWLKSSTDGDTDGGDVCQVADDGPGGILQLTCNDANADTEHIQLNGESFKLASGTELWFFADIAVKDVDACDVFVGLHIAGTSAFTAADRVGFQIDHDGNIDALVEQDGTESATDTGVDVADCAAIANYASKNVELAFHWDGSSAVKFYVNGVLKVTKTDNGTTIVIPDDEALSPAYQVRTHTGAGAVQTIWSDYIEVIAERA